MASGYWQLKIDEQSKEETVFIVENNVYQWNRLAFGLTNASKTFQRTMNHILQQVIGKNLPRIFGRHNCFSKSVEEHAENLFGIFNLLEKANF